MDQLKATNPVKLFVAGTDTNVGKTFAAALVVKMYRHSGVNVGVYKPVASGCSLVDGVLIAADAVALWRAAGEPRTLSDVCPQKFQAPLAPGQAAAAEGKTVDLEQLRAGLNCWERDFDAIVIEGAGGLFSPLADRFLNVDLVKQINADRLIIVAANRLGVIHQVLATCAAAAHRGVTVDGLILSSTSPTSDASVAGNARQIRELTDVPVVAEIPYGAIKLGEASRQRLLDWLI
jgi:dethiobiotin synthetase